MITKEQAIALITSDLDDDMDVMQDSIVEKEYGWVIFTQSKEHIKSRNIRYMTVGSGGTLVEKSTGKKFKFGSAYPVEKNLDIYEKGYFEHDNWDIVVSRVNDLQRTIEHLGKLGITYVQPEEAHGTVWKIQKRFTNKQFQSKLSKLPVRFNLGNVYFLFDTLEELKRQSEFTYSLEGNKGFVNGI